MAKALSKPQPARKGVPLTTRHDLPAAARSKLCAQLNQSLADLSDLASQIKQAHWNVKGNSFYSLHLLFDQLAGALNEPIDTVAERLIALGGIAHGTVRMAAATSQLPELPERFDQMTLIAALADRVATVAKAMRERIDTSDEFGDAVTADLYTGITAELDKTLYLLESHLH
jgi:starvation-inducible DNA-binding protein